MPLRCLLSSSIINSCFSGGELNQVANRVSTDVANEDTGDVGEIAAKVNEVEKVTDEQAIIAHMTASISVFAMAPPL